MCSSDLGVCDGAADFIGHVGGDDFVLLMQSPDWDARLQRALLEFDQGAQALFDEADRAANGFQGIDRQGNPIYFPLTTLSIGAVLADPGMHHSHKEVAARAADAKKRAKQMPGSVYFVERRRPEHTPRIIEQPSVCHEFATSAQ